MVVGGPLKSLSLELPAQTDRNLIRKPRCKQRSDFYRDKKKFLSSWLSLGREHEYYTYHYTMGGWMNGLMDGWMNGWMDIWMDWLI